MMFSRRGLLGLVLATGALAACGGGGGAWATQAFNANGIVVSPERIWNSGGALHFKLHVQNQGPIPITVIRDQITLTLPSGLTVPREETGGGPYHIPTSHAPYEIPPGGEHRVDMAFRGDQRWANVQQVILNFNGAVLVNGQPIAMPPMVINHQ